MSVFRSIHLQPQNLGRAGEEKIGEPWRARSHRTRMQGMYSYTGDRRDTQMDMDIVIDADHGVYSSTR